MSAEGKSYSSTETFSEHVDAFTGETIMESYGAMCLLGMRATNSNKHAARMYVLQFTVWNC